MSPTDLLAYLEDHPALFSSLGAIATGIAGLVGLYFQYLKIKRLHEKIDEQVAEIKDLVASKSSLTEQCGQNVKALNEERERNAELTSALAKSKSDAEAAEQMHIGTTLDMQAEVDKVQKEKDSELRRIQKAIETDGLTWTERVRWNATEFRPLLLGSRQTPIISVVNLKGGVGKTTITANLGAALDHLGYRVLMIDLDLQGSLTGLFMPSGQQEALSDDHKILGDFLASSFGAEYPDLRSYIQPVLSSGRSGLVPTTDTLAYAETNLTLRWLLRDENRDPRLLLRRELHLKRITNDYDVIILDCPPLINVTCVNAMAASDYVLAPILPSKQATDRIPMLLRRLREFRENINPGLNILGVIANRTYRADLTLEEENRLAALRTDARDIWGQEVPLFETFIRQGLEVRAAEDENRPLTENDELFSVFVDLANEMRSRLPTFCRVAQDSAIAKEAVS